MLARLSGAAGAAAHTARGGIQDAAQVERRGQIEAGLRRQAQFLKGLGAVEMLGVVARALVEEVDQVGQAVVVEERDERRTDRAGVTGQGDALLRRDVSSSGSARVAARPLSTACCDGGTSETRYLVPAGSALWLRAPRTATTKASSPCGRLHAQNGARVISHTSVAVAASKARTSSLVGSPRPLAGRGHPAVGGPPGLARRQLGRGHAGGRITSRPMHL